MPTFSTTNHALQFGNNAPTVTITGTDTNGFISYDVSTSGTFYQFASNVKYFAIEIIFDAPFAVPPGVIISPANASTNITGVNFFVDQDDITTLSFKISGISVLNPLLGPEVLAWTYTTTAAIVISGDITINPGSGLTGGGLVNIGGSTTISTDTDLPNSGITNTAGNGAQLALDINRATIEAHFQEIGTSNGDEFPENAGTLLSFAGGTVVTFGLTGNVADGELLILGTRTYEVDTDGYGNFPGGGGNDTTVKWDCSGAGNNQPAAAIYLLRTAIIGDATNTDFSVTNTNGNVMTVLGQINANGGSNRVRGTTISTTCVNGIFTYTKALEQTSWRISHMRLAVDSSVMTLLALEGGTTGVALGQVPLTDGINIPIPCSLQVFTIGDDGFGNIAFLPKATTAVRVVINNVLDPNSLNTIAYLLVVHDPSAELSGGDQVFCTSINSLILP